MNLQTLIDAYRASYQGRDPSLRARLDFWRNHLGHVDLQAIGCRYRSEKRSAP
jgi:hypothetical protein